MLECAEKVASELINAWRPKFGQCFLGHFWGGFLLINYSWNEFCRHSSFQFKNYPKNVIQY